MARLSTFSSAQDQLLDQIYTELKTTPEDLVSDDDEREFFIAQYKERSGDEVHTRKEVCRRLFNLRRSGRLTRLYPERDR